MVSDPYSVLGISPDASDEEVKKAYRNLSRKYHPDSYADNPLSDLAEEKFKEVQDAYKQIMDEREHGGRGGQQSYQQGGQYYQANAGDSPQMASAINFINSGRYRDALDVLNQMSNRNARWYYCSAVANAGIGNNVQAMNDANQAVNMEPNNQEYRNFLNQLQWKTNRYQGYGGSAYGNQQDACGTGNLCCDLWMADTCCECMGGDLCRCM